MIESELLGIIVVALTAAFIGGLLARAVRLPEVSGYIIAGIVVPVIFPWMRHAEPLVRAVADWGIVFLMFAIGVEFSLSEIGRFGGRGVWIAVLQIALTIGLGFALGMSFGWSVFYSVFLGGAVALSSTMVVLRILEQRGELSSGHGHVMLGILIVQDLAVVLMVAVLPILPKITLATLPSLAATLLRAIVFLVAAILLAKRAIPWLLTRVAASGSRELFVIAVVVISFGAAWATERLGFSIALGAFIAGLIISESEYTHQVLADMLPLRDIFSGVFFVSIGALFHPSFLLHNAGEVALTTVVVVFGKFIIVFLLLLLFGLHRKIAFLSGVGLAQIGEFSFLLAAVGLTQGVISEQVNLLIISAAITSILITPLLMAVSPKLYRAVLSIRWLSELGGGEFVEEEECPPEMRDHVILVGFGTVGRLVGSGLHAHDIPYLVIDYDRSSIRRAQSIGVMAIYGDGANPAVLKRAGLSKAALVVVALPESIDSRLAVRAISHLNPKVPVLARAPSEMDVFSLYAEGADEVVYPKFEAGLEFLRHALPRFNVPEDRIDQQISSIRYHLPPEGHTEM